LGPRQSGKTTLARHLFHTHRYLNLENPETRLLAQTDPKSIFSKDSSHLILDEIQRVPELLSYLQVMVDEPDSKWRFILTGSQSPELSKHISQTLAGRTRIFKILPLSYLELKQNGSQKSGLDEQMLTGFYPRLYHENLDSQEWLASYFETYVERDVRQLMNIKELDEFERFIRLCGGRVGQLVNFSQLGNDAGVTQPTAQSWLSLLKATFVLFTLSPHHQNFNKRIVKTPKIYFHDVGLLCYLLKIKTVDQLSTHPLRGNIFENFIVAEMQKKYFNRGEESPLYFWRDQKGMEIDVLVDLGTSLFPVEIKSGSTFQADFLKSIEKFNQLSHHKGGQCIYGGSGRYQVKGIDVTPWDEVI
jgi:predicted AAA+ superfamily ATPase